jgi:hypothetical protein
MERSMTRNKLIFVVVTGVLVPFLAAFIITVAPALRDEDTVTTKELTSPVLTADPPQPQKAGSSAEAKKHENVDPDCYGDGMTCRKARLADVIAIADMLSPVMSKAGWPSGCFELQIIGGDNGEADVVSIAVEGPPGHTAPQCKEGGGRKVDKSKLRTLGQAVVTSLKGSSAVANVDLVQVTDGNDSDVQIPFK